MAEATDTQSTSSGARNTTRASRLPRRRSDEPPGVHVPLFFVFMLTFFGLYSLMFCTFLASLTGAFLVSIALLILISVYLGGA